MLELLEGKGELEAGLKVVLPRRWHSPGLLTEMMWQSCRSILTGRMYWASGGISYTARERSQRCLH